MKKFLLGMNLFIGLGALSGGVLALSTNAHASFGIDSSLLVHSPFTTFLIPGLFLLFVLGFGNLFLAFYGVKSASFPYTSCLMGMILIAWIIIQCLFLASIAFLHVLFFALGFIQFIGGWRLAKKESVPFPFSAKKN